MSVAVIGAGPSGWAATNQLLDMGLNVTVIEPGINEQSPAQYFSKKEKTNINLKLLHGSNYPYRQFSLGPQILQNNVDLASSFAQQGLSLVWGATVLPYNQLDILDWPITIDELDDSYQYLTKKIPISGREDNLTKNYRAYISQNVLVPSVRFLQFIEKAEAYESEAITVGSSRLAVKVQSRSGAGCYYCSKCLTGCADGNIWTANKLIDSRLKYISGYRILSISEDSDGVVLEGINQTGEQLRPNRYDKVFLATGTIETFRILATSKLVSEHATIQDSSTFFLPALLSTRYPKTSDSNYSLSQSFMRIETDASHAVNLQFYDYSEDLISRTRSSILLGRFVPKWIMKMALKRLFMIIGYFPSSQSSSIKIELDENHNVILSNSSLSEMAQKENFRNLKIRSNGFFGFVKIRPLWFLMKIGAPGQGVHSGGWLPMGSKSDLQGRPVGCVNIHVVDSSILPSIPAGPITFTVMANAVRVIKSIYK